MSDKPEPEPKLEVKQKDKEADNTAQQPELDSEPKAESTEIAINGASTSTSRSLEAEAERMATTRLEAAKRIKFIRDNLSEYSKSTEDLDRISGLSDLSSDDSDSDSDSDDLTIYEIPTPALPEESSSEVLRQNRQELADIGVDLVQHDRMKQFYKAMIGKPRKTHSDFIRFIRGKRNEIRNRSEIRNESESASASGSRASELSEPSFNDTISTTQGSEADEEGIEMQNPNLTFSPESQELLNLVRANLYLNQSLLSTSSDIDRESLEDLEGEVIEKLASNLTTDKSQPKSPSDSESLP